MNNDLPERPATIDSTLTRDIVAWVVGPTARGLRPIATGPQLSNATNVLLCDVVAFDEHGEQRSLQIPQERPLVVVLNGVSLVTLLTLGAAPELLVLGFLRNQRIIDAASDVRSIVVDWNAGSAVVAAPHAGVAKPRAAGVDVASASVLGTVFDDVMKFAPNGSPAGGASRTSRAALLKILDTMQTYDAIHRAAGSVHSCALFEGTELLVAIEDVSRHNGVDTVVGWMLQYGVVGDAKTLFTTGRLTAEMVMKAAHNGISTLVSRNGVTSMGYELAAKFGMNLFARAAKRRYMTYLGAGRLDD